ncbi:3-dehydroquinate dehydratase [Propioniciclava sp. MC1595]|jgi:3-dehydroquinate dehydratase-2|uniref:type II 3-dehydroquinate dehydratase n=1 Tax=unclassified Propioniciclava TaxID=2642922 RepID=UPI0015FF48D3|nr:MULTISPECIES: type II 3-dehydroquinate dehydratase [unclassified Propioniciclava]MBB1494189.1 3-dehydroquinate dehydratase [Propioniciclava sp. MC1595]MBB1502403.1 3-dehydroquinate dehydratase [Propioniciclava sp. MC1683]NLE17370.1 3-dehydroquinate dehydratase [Propioniciclava sp.]QTE25171.1 3-dehydroquinate dehydratase [Propioniciclava sp. MC1595]
MKVLVLNGVNLGRLGTRQPEVYGATTHAELAEHLVGTGRGLGLDVEVRQTDSEAEMVGWLHEAASTGAAVVINPAAWSHYSYAIADAVVQVETVVEVHISNVHAREEWRHQLVISPYVVGTIMGLGLGGYDLALAHLASRQ